MTREEIIKASQKYVKLKAREREVLYGLYTDIQAAFLAGAEFAEEHQNVWHDASKEPKWNEPMLGEDSEGFSIYKWVGQEDCWFTFVDVFGLNRWAYIKDLLPKEVKEINTEL